MQFYEMAEPYIKEVVHQVTVIYKKIAADGKDAN